MSRNPRPCPVCGEIYEPRKVGGNWTKSCSTPCSRELIARAMRNGGAKKAAAASAAKQPPHVDLECEVCGHKWKVPPSHTKGRRTCSMRCLAVLMRREQPEKRRGEKNPNWRGGQRAGVRERSGERRWREAMKPVCQHPDCTLPRGRLAIHHCIYEQQLRVIGGDRWDPRNALTLCTGCHMSHHRRGSVIPVSVLPDSVFDFALEVLGAGPAFEYIRRRYAGADPRLDLLLKEADGGNDFQEADSA